MEILLILVSCIALSGSIPASPIVGVTNGTHLFMSVGRNVDDKLEVLDCLFYRALSESQLGGALWVEVMVLIVMDTTFTECRAPKAGAIYTCARNLTHRRCCVRECWAFTQEDAGHFMATEPSGSGAISSGVQTTLLKCGHATETNPLNRGTILGTGGSAGEISGINFTSCLVAGDGATYREEYGEPTLHVAWLLVVDCEGISMFSPMPETARNRKSNEDVCL
jgi:hypothetical protein